jgi:hypothetical protein
MTKGKAIVVFGQGMVVMDMITKDEERCAIFFSECEPWNPYGRKEGSGEIRFLFTDVQALRNVEGFFRRTRIMMERLCSFRHMWE